MAQMEAKAVAYPVNADASPRRPVSPCDVAAALVAPAMILALLVTYLVSPDFYLTWVLNEKQRETQIVEYLTFGSSALAGVMLLIGGVRLWRRQRRSEPGAGSFWRRHVHDRGGAWIVLVVAAAALFLAGEEISWGQTYLGWDTPEPYERLSVETNLHNTDLPVNNLGSLFLLAVFVALPIVWALRSDRLPRSWAPAIPEWPVVVTVLVAFLWKEYKNVYRMIYSDGPDASPFYIGFVEQINEHKEMLAGVGLLMYALYRWRAVRRHAEADPTHGRPASAQTPG